MYVCMYVCIMYVCIMYYARMYYVCVMCDEGVFVGERAYVRAESNTQ